MSDSTGGRPAGMRPFWQLSRRAVHFTFWGEMTLSVPPHADGSTWRLSSWTQTIGSVCANQTFTDLETARADALAMLPKAECELRSCVKRGSFS
jgi:hypothetical protein